MVDVVLLRGDNKLKKGEFRLGRVKALNNDSDGLVRMVVVGCRTRRRRGRADEENNQVPLDLFPMAVPLTWRKIVLCPLRFLLAKYVIIFVIYF